MERVSFAEREKVFQERKCGFKVLYFIKEETLEELKDFMLYDDDVWIVSYPKSGTTWTQQIVKLLRGNGVQDDERIIHSVPFLEGVQWYPGINIHSVPRPRAFMSHFPYNIFPCGPPNTHPCKYIYVARNLKDVAVSYFFMLHLFFTDMEWNTYWPNFISWSLGFDNYFDHVLSWWEHRHDENVLFLKYEDMKRDLPHHVSKIASFIGTEISANVLTKIASMTTFDKMRDNPTTNYEWRSKDIKFMRKGVVGDWKNFLTEEQSAQVDALIAKRFDGTGLEFEFE